MIIVSCSDDRTIRLWDAISGALLKTIEGHTHFVRSVVFSPNGTTLASGSHDKTVRTWNVTTGEVVQVFNGHMKMVLTVAYSSDGDKIASGSLDRTVRLWDSQTGEALKVLEGHTTAVLSVAFCPRRLILASISSDDTMCLWDTDAGQMLHKISMPQERLLVDYRLDFTPSGTIITATDGLTVFAWKFTPGKVPKSVKESSSAVYPTALAFSPDGAVLALGGADHNVHLLDATTLIPASDKMNAFLLASLPRNAYSPAHSFLLQDHPREVVLAFLTGNKVPPGASSS